MRWSWKVARLAGIELRLHATFVLLLAWLALAYYRSSGTVGGAAAGLLFILALFGSVVLHELGHALVARRFGVPTRDITLLPIGGVARLEHIPERPVAELWIAVAGPLVTAVIVILLYAGLRLFGYPLLAPAGALSRASGSAFVGQLLWMNVTLLVFNLLPAFPMDGGRVLRALLALRMDYGRATEIAARVGRAFALVFGMIGLLYDPFLVLIALFVWLGAAGESGALQMRTTLAGVDVERIMIRDVSTLAPHDTLEVALQHVLGGFQQDFPVVDGTRVVGVLTRAALLRGLALRGRDSTVDASMERTFQVAQPGEPVERAMARLHGTGCRTLPVLSEGRLRGVLTLDNIGEFVMIAAALRSSTTGHPA